MLQRVFTADLDLSRLAAAEARAPAPGAADTDGGPRAAGPAATGLDRAARNGQVDDAALDGLAGGAAAGGGEP
jgi:hypothetical protein